MVEINQSQQLEQQQTGPAAPSGGQGPETVARSQFQIAWMRFREHKLAMFSLFFLVVLYLSAIFADKIAPFDPDELDLNNVRQAPSSEHWMGTDAIGRDEFSRVIYGGRVSLAVGLGVAVSGVLVGTVLGSIAGYYGRWLDNILMRVTDFFLLIPTLAVLLMGAKALGDSEYGKLLAQQYPALPVTIILSSIAWMPIARIVRGQVLSIKEKEYIEAARALGTKTRRIIWRHMLPNTLGPIVVNLTLGIALAILAESTLSYLGFGVQPPTATWGNMLAGSEEAMTTQPWLVWFPGMMILVTVLCVNFLGDGLRDALDPTAQRVRQ